MDIVLVPGVKKLAEVIIGGIGDFAGSFLTVRIARKNAEATKITARAEAEALGIRAEAHKGALLATSAGYDEARIQSPDVAIQSSEISLGEVIEQKNPVSGSKKATQYSGGSGAGAAHCRRHTGPGPGAR